MTARDRSGESTPAAGTVVMLTGLEADVFDILPRDRWVSVTELVHRMRRPWWKVWLPRAWGTDETLLALYSLCGQGMAERTTSPEGTRSPLSYFRRAR